MYFLKYGFRGKNSFTRRNMFKLGFPLQQSWDARHEWTKVETLPANMAMYQEEHGLQRHQDLPIRTAVDLPEFTP